MKRLVNLSAGRQALVSGATVALIAVVAPQWVGAQVDPGGCTPPFRESCCGSNGACYSGPGFRVADWMYNGCVGSCSSTSCNATQPCRECIGANNCTNVPPPGYQGYYVKLWQPGFRDFDCNGNPQGFECTSCGTSYDPGCFSSADQPQGVVCGPTFDIQYNAYCQGADYSCHWESQPIDCEAGGANAATACGSDPGTTKSFAQPCDAAPPPADLPSPDSPNCGNGPASTAGQPVDVLYGAMWHTETDFRDPVGQPFDLSLRRTYRSRITASGLFGQGWATLFGVRLEFPVTTLVRFRDPYGEAWAFVVDPADPTSYLSVSGNTKDLVKNGDGTFSLADSVSGTTYRFLSTGVISSVTQLSGQGVAFGYDGSGNLANVTDAAGRELLFTVTQGLVQQIVWNGITIASYGYTNGQLTSATYPDGANKSYSYALQGNGQILLTQITDEQGRVEAGWSYDSTGRAVSSVGAGGNHAVTLSYTPSRVTDAFGKVTTYTQNPAGLRVNAVSGPGCPTCGDSNVV